MKNISFLLTALLFCVLMSASALSEDHTHQVLCSEPDVCVICGATEEEMGEDKQIIHETLSAAFDLTSHWQVCGVCGAELDQDEHTASCDAPDVCQVCGAAAADGAIIPYTSHKSLSLCCDEYTHWYHCSTCGSVFGKARHVALCTAPDVCFQCGAPFIGEEAIMHLDYHSGILYDEKEHWCVCSACGKETLKEPHYTLCTDPIGSCSLCGVSWTGEVHHEGLLYYVLNENEHFSTCFYCGETFSAPHYYLDGYCLYCGLEKNHAHSSAAGTWQSDQEKHWQVCDACGAYYNVQNHTAACTERDVCMVCGAKKEDSAQIDDVIHTNAVLQHDAARHWIYCLDCGAEYNRYPHYALCGDPKTCAECGADYHGYDIRHTNLDMDHPQHNSYAHWYRCLDCGGKTREERHYIRCGSPDGVCTGCGVPWYGSVKHVNDSKGGYLYYNEQYHLILCTVCGQLVQQEHTNIDEYCPLCGGKGPHRHVLRRIDRKEPGCEDGYILYQCWECGAEEMEILPGGSGHQTVQLAVGSAVIPYCTVCRQAVVDGPCQEISVGGQRAVIRDLNACLDQSSNILMAFSVEPPQGSPEGMTMDALTVSVKLPDSTAEDTVKKASLYKAEEMKEAVVITFDMEEDDFVFEIGAPAVSFSVSDGFLIFQANGFGIYFVAQ